MDEKIQRLKERVYQANMELNERGLVLYTFGNASGVDRDLKLIAIKPSGVPYSELSPEKMVLVDFENRVVEGNARPSSDTKTHLCLYQAFSEIGGIAHTHSTYASIWAQAKKSIPCLGTTHADYVNGEIPCTSDLHPNQIQRDYEYETGVQIIERMKGLSPREVEMILVAGHGPFTWGQTPEKAVFNSVLLEEISKTSLYTTLLNPNAGPISSALLSKHFSRKQGANSYYGQPKKA